MADPTNGSMICQYGSQELSGYSGPDPINISGAAAVLAAFGASPPAWLIPLLADLGSPTQSVADFCATSPNPPGDFDPAWLIPAPFGPVDGYANAVQWVYNRLWLALWSETCQCTAVPPPTGDICVATGTFQCTHAGLSNFWTWTEPAGVGVAHFRFEVTCNSPGTCSFGVEVDTAGTSWPAGSAPCPLAPNTLVTLDVLGGGTGTPWRMSSSTGSCTTNTLTVNWSMCYTPSFSTYSPPTPPPAIQPPVPPSLPTPITPVAPTTTATITPAEWCSVLWSLGLLPATWITRQSGLSGEGSFPAAGWHGLVAIFTAVPPNTDIGWNTFPLTYYRALYITVRRSGSTTLLPATRLVQQTQTLWTWPWDDVDEIFYKTLPGYIWECLEALRTCPS